jgi:heme/copper-type cytochrome/quinol oxidase subunit 3
LAIIINWVAVVVVAIIYFAIVFFWYFPSLFGNLWLKLVGKESEPKSKIIRDTIIMIPTSFITILFIEIMMDLTNMNDLPSALLLTLLLWIGFVGIIGINQTNFNDRGLKLFLIEYGVYLVGFLISGLILAVWP